MTAKIKKIYFFLKIFFEIYFFEIFHLTVHVGEQCIDNCNGSHGLYNDHCSWYDNGVMATPDADRDLFSRFIYGVLDGRDGRRWFDADPHDQITSVADAP